MEIVSSQPINGMIFTQIGISKVEQENKEEVVFGVELDLIAYQLQTHVCVPTTLKVNVNGWYKRVKLQLKQTLIFDLIRILAMDTRINYHCFDLWTRTRFLNAERVCRLNSLSKSSS